MSEEIIKSTTSKGAAFKKKFGISKTLKRLLDKNGKSWTSTEDIAQYKKDRRERKRKEKASKNEKHRASVTYKRTHGKPKTNRRTAKKGKKDQKSTSK